MPWLKVFKGTGTNKCEWKKKNHAHKPNQRSATQSKQRDERENEIKKGTETNEANTTHFEAFCIIYIHSHFGRLPERINRFSLMSWVFAIWWNIPHRITNECNDANAMPNMLLDYYL